VSSLRRGSFAAAPIPPLAEPPDWARLPIVECGEPLVALADGDGGLRVRPQYALAGIPGARATLLVRSGVRERLFQAASALPDDVALLVFDGFRPLSVQRFLFESYQAEVRAREPHLSEEAVRRIVNRFVASPSADPRCPPPHGTGGAVDVYLVEAAAAGRELPMGTAPDETGPASETRYFEEFPQEPFATHRRLLFHAMTRAGGFTNYHGEWWHYDWGNQRWANCSGAPHAVYGMAAEDPNGPV
jgi:D-alanyl-D-alanine dipeptidase